MTEHDVFEPLEAIGIELGAQSRFADDRIAEHDVALQNTFAGAFGTKCPFVFGDFPRVVDEHAGHRQTRVDFAVEW